MDSELQADVVFLFVLFYFINFFYKLQIKCNFFSKHVVGMHYKKFQYLNPSYIFLTL